MAGIDQTSISRRPEYSKSGRVAARAYWMQRNQKATPSVARIVGITIASMMPSELNRIIFSADGDRTFRIEDAFRAAAEHRRRDQGKSSVSHRMAS